MIDLIFYQASEIIIVRIKGNAITFGSTTYGAKMADISGLKLDFQGTIREFPDLEKDLEWREKAIKRFKDHIRKLKSEEEIADYIIKELRTKGYTPKLKQVAGHRPKKIQWKMGSIDAIINSPLTVYLGLGLFALHIYLKKTGKTFKEWFDGMRETFATEEEYYYE